MRGLVELVAPTMCGACGEPGEELCERCADDVIVLHRPWCERCGTPISRSRCPVCDGLVGFSRARSLVAFAEPARRLTLDLKRRARPRLVAALGELLAALARREGLDGDVVTWVPGGAGTVRAGYDHAQLLAEATAGGLGVLPARLLRRATDGPRQADVDLAHRRSNVRGRFAARRRLDGAHVLLVDDVFTTGATAEACALSLLEAGAASADVLTWARTLRKGAGPAAILSS